MKATFSILLLAMLLICGCQTVPVAGTATVQQPVIDPCAARLHDIGGAILLYYAIHRAMPPRLEDVASLADIDAPLQFTCPVSNQPYLYNPKGLSIPGTEKRVIVYDPTPAHDAKRNCLLMPPISPGQALSTDVQSFPEQVFKAFR